MSGGVDSSVSAYLLKQQGYDVTGVFIKVWQPDFLECTWKEDRLDAMRVAAQLDIPFITLDLEKEYKQGVIDYMINEYREGRTPNPDVMCNKSVKFGAFLSFALEHGADYVATGHYAQVKRVDDEYQLVAGNDQSKDQSYFLWTLTQKELAHILFPVGHLEKQEVRRIAESAGLKTASKKDSQGLCFVGAIDIKDFLRTYIPIQPGAVVTTEGEVIGEHDGATFFTIGERRGFIIHKKTPHDKPYYVVSKNLETNTLIVSTDTPHERNQSAKEIILRSVSWTSVMPQEDEQLYARVRYRQILMPCTVQKDSTGSTKIIFTEGDDTATPGQSCVIYRENGECVGGGIIE